MNQAELDARKKAMEPWYWWGISTFFKCPWDEDPGNCDIALVGVPHSSGNGSTERDQHLGPRLVRHVSGRYRRAHQAYQLRPWDELRINDLGDVPLPQAMVNDISVEHIEDYYRLIDRAGARPVSIGGDHAITGPILKALAGSDAQSTGGRKVAMVHFDAHRDDYDHMADWLGSVRSAAHWAAYLVAEGHVDPAHSIQLGMRGNPLEPSDDPTRSAHGYRIVPAELLFEQGLATTARIMRERVGELPVYITFDLDALDPVDAPGVANLEAGYRGLRAWEAIKLIQGLRGCNVIGADIVCPMPTVDHPNQLTSLTTTVLMFELLCLIGDYLRAQRVA